MTPRRCLMCGQPLPVPRWWAWPFQWMTAPVHGPGDATCHRAFNRRMGLPEDVV